MKNMKNGYQIIEPNSLESLLGNPSHAAIAVAALEWAVDRLKLQSPHLFDDVTVEVVLVSYLGAYPAIGIRYKHEDAPDHGPAISDAIDAIVRQLPFSDFLAFVEKSNSDWCEVWQEIKRSPRLQ